MENFPLVSVIMAVYNAEKHLEDSVLSVLGQSYSNFEFIIIDDGSTDSGYEMLQKFSLQDKRIKLIKINVNIGLTKNLNIAIQIAEGDLFMRMDADDICILQRMEKQVDFLLTHPEVDIVGSAIEEIDEHGKSFEKKIFYPETHLECLKFFRKRDPLAHPAVMMRKRFIVKAGLYNEAYRTNQDTYMWLQGFLNGCIFANMNEVLLKFRITDSFYNKRRNGIKRARALLKLRLEVSRKLHFGMQGFVNAYLVFILTVSPGFIRKFAYRILR